MARRAAANPYGWKHQQARASLGPAVKRGEAYCSEIICLEPDRWIEPGTPWDLAHDRRNGGYLGPAHERCNRAEGARHRHGAAAAPSRWVL